MKQLERSLLILLLIVGMSGCEMSETDLSFDMSGNSELPSLKSAGLASMLAKATGSVEFLWKGGEKGGDMGNKPDDLRAFFSFDAHAGNNIKPPKGEIIYTVTYPDLSPHREIRAAVTGIFVNGQQAWITGVVVSDTKGCNGDGNGGHDSNCSGSSGGCGEEIDGHDGGCSDSGIEEGGCSDHGTDEGECSDGGTDEGGCSDNGTGEEGCSGGGMETGGSPGSTGGTMGNPLSGKNCRLGQIIAVKVHDKGTPGTNGDVLSWKWFSPTGAFIPTAENTNLWAAGGGEGHSTGFVKLCKKTIIEGNIVVHN